MMGRRSKETKLTAAERCKRYRETHRNEYRAADNLRQKVKRALSKLNPELEKKRLKKQADAKKLQRMRKKSSSNEDRDREMTSTLYHTHKSAGISIIHEGLPKIATVHCYDGANIATFNLEACFPKHPNTESQMQKQQLNYEQFRYAPPPQPIERGVPKRTVNPVYVDQTKFIENIQQANFPVNQSLNRSFNPTLNNPIIQTVNQTMNQPINRSINQPTNQRTVPPNNQQAIHDRDATAKNGVWVCNHCGLILLNGDNHNCIQQNESKGMPQLDYFGPGVQQPTNIPQPPNRKTNRKPRKPVNDTNRFNPENNYDYVIEANRAFRNNAYNERFAYEGYPLGEYSQQDPRNIIFAKDVINQQQQQQQQPVNQLAIDTPQVDPITGGVPKILNSYSTAYSVDSISPNSITSNDINDERLIQTVNHSEPSTKDSLKRGKRMNTNLCIKCNKPKWQNANSNLPFDGCKCHEMLTPISVPDLKREEVSPPRKRQCSQIIIIDDPTPLNLRDLDLETSSTLVNIVENNLYKGDGILSNNHLEDKNNETSILDKRLIEMAIEPLLTDSELMKIKKEIRDEMDELRTNKGKIINAINDENKETLISRNFEFSSEKEIFTSKIHQLLPNSIATTNKTIEPNTTVTTNKVNQFVENKQNEVISDISDVMLDKEKTKLEHKPPTSIINAQINSNFQNTMHYFAANDDKLLPRKERYDVQNSKSLLNNERFGNETSKQMQCKEVDNSKNIECTQHKESITNNMNISFQSKQNELNNVIINEKVSNELRNEVLDVKTDTNSFSNGKVLQDKAEEVCKSINSSRKDNLNYNYTSGSTTNSYDEIFLLKEDVIKKGMEMLPLKGDNINGGNQILTHKERSSISNDPVLTHKYETVDGRNDIPSSNDRDKSGKNKILEHKVEVLTSNEVIMPRKLEVIYSINEKVEVVSSSYDLTTCTESDANNNNETFSRGQELFNENNETTSVQDLYDEIFDLVIDESFE